LPRTKKGHKTAKKRGPPKKRFYCQRKRPLPSPIVLAKDCTTQISGADKKEKGSVEPKGSGPKKETRGAPQRKSTPLGRDKTCKPRKRIAKVSVGPVPPPGIKDGPDSAKCRQNWGAPKEKNKTGHRREPKGGPKSRLTNELVREKTKHQNKSTASN